MRNFLHTFENSEACVLNLQIVDLPSFSDDSPLLRNMRVTIYQET
jgi:hypothetical protein